MRNHILSFVCFLIFAITSFAQSNLEQKISEYFKLDYETIFTHVNKTKFFEGEELWFKTYVYDVKRQLPYISSTNIYAGIYDNSGNLVQKKIYLSESGMAHGNFAIDSTFAAGIYYLKTSTNWMRNFHEDRWHIQKFEIIRGKAESNTPQIIQNNYDFQLLPESGYIIENTINSVGFKLLDASGKSQKIEKGKILDESGKLIAIFQSNEFGLGKFVFRPETGHSYFYELLLENGDVLKNPILNINPKGVNLMVDNLQEENLIVRINTNPFTLPDLIDKPYQLIIHRDGMMNKIDFNFSENQLSYQFKIDREFLNAGINIITLFDDLDRPIAERLIFNPQGTPVRRIATSKVYRENDSLVVRLESTENTETINLSISVLPNSSEAHDRDSNIISSLLINPYIKGTLENAWYYFDEPDNEKIYNLDLLLLTQGWSRYSWDNVFNNPPKINHSFETGFVIRGKLNNYKYKEGDVLILQSLVNGLQEEFKMDENNLFGYDNIYLGENTTLNFTLKNKNGTTTKPNVYYNVYPTNVKDDISTPKENIGRKQAIFGNFDSLIFDDNFTILDTVSLSTSYKNPKPKNKPLGMMNARHISFADNLNFAGLIIDQIRMNGFDVSSHGTHIHIVSRRSMNLSGNLSPRVFLDNVDISNQLDIILNLQVVDVEEMFISNSSNLYASAGGVIQIFTKTGLGKRKKSTFAESQMSFGYSAPKEYYSPAYNKIEKENFKKGAVLNWIPSVTVSETGELTFKIPYYADDDINLYIEGMDQHGHLFSNILTIPQK